MGNLIIGSPLTLGPMFSGVSRCFRDYLVPQPSFDAALAAGRPVDTTCFATVLFKTCCTTLGAFVPARRGNEQAVDALALAESSDNFALACGLTSPQVH